MKNNRHESLLAGVESNCESFLCRVRVESLTWCATRVGFVAIRVNSYVTESYGWKHARANTELMTGLTELPPQVPIMLGIHDGTGQGSQWLIECPDIYS